MDVMKNRGLFKFQGHNAVHSVHACNTVDFQKVLEKLMRILFVPMLHRSNSIDIPNMQRFRSSQNNYTHPYSPF